ncbi:MAG TPA: hypothetical protein VFA20_14520 [Myxococcaceae bacterium]|nr:hypothetical protein [Myxococcaceae bacterium]
MRTVAPRVLASVLVGLLSASCGTMPDVLRPDANEELFFLPRAPRGVASPVVEGAELRRAIEELLPYVNVEATQAKLTRLLADPRFHGHRPEELQVVLASWGSGPSNLEAVTRGYRDWCSHSKQSECIARTLTNSDVYEIAFDFALGSQWDGFVKEVKSTIDPGTIRTVLLTGMVIFMASIAFPELASKIPAAVATAILTAWIGAQAICDLIFGWIRMVGELDAAASFDQVRAAGVRYGEKIGVQTARILILLATAAIAEGGLIARLMKLPRASEASAALATETGGVGLEMTGQVKGVRVTAGGVAITVDSPAMGAVTFAMAGHGPGSGSSAPTPPKLRGFTEDNFRENLGRLTGHVPEGTDAHHVLPQEFRSQCRRAGINIDDPRYGAWWERTAHQQASSAYNNEWRKFFRNNPSPSAEQILQFGREMAAEYGLHVDF